MGFSVFLALLVHGILLFGIGVSRFEPNVQPAHITLELGLSGDSSTQQTAVTAPLSENLDSPAEAAKSLGKEKVSPETTVTKPTETTQRFKELSQTTTQQSEQTFNSRDAVEAFAKFQASIDSQRPTSQGLSRTRELNSFSKFTAQKPPI